MSQEFSISGHKSDIADASEVQKSDAAYRSISEVATLLSLPSHVLRFWETKFPQIQPLKRRGGRRFYRPEDIRFLRIVQKLLHDEGYTIKGVQKLLDENAIDLKTGQLQSALIGSESCEVEQVPSRNEEILSEILQELSQIRDVLTSDG